MRILDLFNGWKPISAFDRFSLEMKTDKINNDGNIYVTVIRDKNSKIPVLKSRSTSEQSSINSALKALRLAGKPQIYKAIETKVPIDAQRLYTEIEKERSEKEEKSKKIQWRDGANHRHRAQMKIVGESLEGCNMKKPRNFVAKNARKFNKAAIMRDKKNDYRRRERTQRDSYINTKDE